jgi:hypothetical protein
MALSEQCEALRLRSALARTREGSDGSGANHDFLTRAAPPCGGTEPAPRESAGERGMAGDLLGVRSPISVNLTIRGLHISKKDGKLWFDNLAKFALSQQAQN